ncbi:hypothetical protein [Methylobacterium sp. 77]|uniref:hypothetical protein n=1 Tax=Methylobacterium sp. 77 TaxID=1101192 RepID=UPI0012DCA643|nr:hypothetical protein [Methylobacterium sp. 77]
MNGLAIANRAAPADFGLYVDDEGQNRRILDRFQASIRALDSQAAFSLAERVVVGRQASHENQDVGRSVGFSRRNEDFPAARRIGA